MPRIRSNHARTPMLVARDHAIKRLISIRRKVKQAMAAADKAQRLYCICYPESIAQDTSVYCTPLPVAVDVDDARRVAKYGDEFHYAPSDYFMPEEHDFDAEREDLIMAFRTSCNTHNDRDD